MKSKLLSNLFIFSTVSAILTVSALPIDSPQPSQEAYNATLARETISSAVHTLLYKYYYQEANLLYTREYLSSIIEAELLLYGLLTESNSRAQFSSKELADLQAEVDSFAAYQYINKFKGMEDMIASAISKPSQVSKHLQNLFNKNPSSSSSFAVAIQNEENRKSLIDAIINDDNIDRYVTLFGGFRMLRQKSMSATEFLQHKLHLNLTKVITLFEDSSQMWITIVELRKKMEDSRNDQEMYSFAKKIQASSNITCKDDQNWGGKERQRKIFRGNANVFYVVADDFLKILQGEKKMLRALNLTEFEMIVEVLDLVQSYKGKAILSYYSDVDGDTLRRSSNRIEQDRLEDARNEKKQQKKNQGIIEQAAEDESYLDQQFASKLDGIVQSLSELQNRFQELKVDQDRFNGEIKIIQGSLKDLEKTVNKSNTDKLLKQSQQQNSQAEATNKKERQQQEQDEPDILEDSDKSKTKIVNKDENSKDNDDDDDDGGFASIKVLFYSAAATLIVAFGIIAYRKYQLRKLNRELVFRHNIMKEEEL